MAELSLAFLGAPLIQHAGRAVSFPTRKAVALLCYLAVEGTVQSRDKLTVLFWSESDAAQGRASLRGTLAYIRESLREPTGKAHDHLLTDRESVGLDLASDVTLDVQSIAAGAQAARRASLVHASAEIKPLLTQLRAAAEKVRGEFLEGFSLSDAPEFDDWATLQRERWHRQASQIFDALSQLQFESGELNPALESAARWSALDVFNEAAQRRRVQIQLALGERAAALQTYQEYAALLRRELNAEPSPETQALAERARTLSFSVHENVRADAVQPLTSDVPLVGRRAEHLQLVNAFRAARRGHTQIVLVQGEPGIGKTRLAREFLAWAAAHGAELLRGRAFETNAQLPYQPLVAALREHVAHEENLDALLTRTWWSELARVLPELADRLPDLAAPMALEEPAARPRLFEAVARLTLALAARAPVVWFIDDAPWADAASLDLLAYAIQRWTAANTPILVLLTARSEDLAQGLEGWLAQFAREAELTRVTLAPLDLDATTELVQEFGIRADESEFSARVFAETRGQPFFVLEVLKSLVERQVLTRDAIGNWSPTNADALARSANFLPPSLRELIRARLARLSSDARALCGAAAVLGDGARFLALCHVAELETSSGLGGLEETLQRGLLRESNDRYFFTHDKLREAVYAETSQARRVVLHQRALQALGEERASAAERARHALAAGLNERAAVLLVEAGDDALRVFAVRNAIQYFEQAMAGGLTNTAVLEKLGRAYEYLNDWMRARAMYEQMQARARAENDAAAQTIALNRLATVAAQGFFDLPLALNLLQQALDVAERSGEDARRADTEWSLAQVYFYIWDLDTARSHAERVLTLARRLENTELTARSMYLVAYIGSVSYALLAEVEEQAERARAPFAQLGNRVMEVECLTVIAIARVFAGFPRETLQAGEQGFAIAREIENPWGQANSTYPRVFALLDLGKFQAALGLAQSGVAAARAAGHPPILVFNLSALGRSFRALGDLDGARAAHLEAHAISEQLHHPFVGELAALDLCADYALAGEWDKAHEFARARAAVGNYARLYPGFTRFLETEAFIRAGEVDAAEQDIENYGKHIANNQRSQIQYHRARAVLAKARGDSSGAASALAQARELAVRLGLEGQVLQLDDALSSLAA